MRLSDLPIGGKSYISHVDGDSAFVKRLMEMGFIAVEEVKVASKAPLADPREYIIRGTSVTLRTCKVLIFFRWFAIPIYWYFMDKDRFLSSLLETC